MILPYVRNRRVGSWNFQSLYLHLNCLEVTLIMLNIYLFQIFLNCSSRSYQTTYDIWKKISWKVEAGVL